MVEILDTLESISWTAARAGKPLADSLYNLPNGNIALEIVKADARVNSGRETFTESMYSLAGKLVEMGLRQDMIKHESQV